MPVCVLDSAGTGCPLLTSTFMWDGRTSTHSPSRLPCFSLAWVLCVSLLLPSLLSIPHSVVLTPLSSPLALFRPHFPLLVAKQPPLPHSLPPPPPHPHSLPVVPSLLCRQITLNICVVEHVFGHGSMQHRHMPMRFHHCVHSVSCQERRTK